MPEITRFYGIVIKMFFKPKEHEPSHIHALYGEYPDERDDSRRFTSKSGGHGKRMAR